jgi:hypothetical protein
LLKQHYCLQLAGMMEREKEDAFDVLMMNVSGKSVK